MITKSYKNYPASKELIFGNENIEAITRVFGTYCRQEAKAQMRLHEHAGNTQSLQSL